MALKLLPVDEYHGVNRNDPIRFYSLPVIGSLYRGRVEICLSQLQGGERILEVGYGSGVTFPNLNDKYDEIHGIDLSANPQAVAAVFQRHGINTFLRSGNVLELPYLDNYFDTVLLISILEHLQPNELEKAFSEISRVLKKGGRVIYGVPYERSYMTLFFALLGYNIHKHHFSSEKDVLNAAARHLELVDVFNMCAFGFLKVYQRGVFRKR